MKEDVESVKDLVERVLRENPKTRDSDTWLILQVLKERGFYLVKEGGSMDEEVGFDDVGDIPSFESVTRCRRRIQNDEERLRSSDVVEENRRVEEEKMSDIDKWWV